MGDNDWVIWNDLPGRGIVLRDRFDDRRSWTGDLDGGLAFDTSAEAWAVAEFPDGSGGGIASQRGWVKDLALNMASLESESRRNERLAHAA